MPSPFEQITSPPQAFAERVINRAFESLEHAAVYAKDPANTSALTWAYLGGRWSGHVVAPGTLTLTNASANYIVVARDTGVISVSTADTHWTDSANYARVYKVTTAGGVIVPTTGEEDHRAGEGGIGGGGAGAGVPPGGTTGQVLGKLSDADGDADWIAASAGGGGGGGVLTDSKTGDGATAINTASTTPVDITGFPALSVDALVDQWIELKLEAGIYSDSAPVSAFIGFDAGGTYIPSVGVTFANAGYETPLSARVQFKVVSDMLSGGRIACKPQWKAASSGTFSLENSANARPVFSIANLGDGKGRGGPGTTPVAYPFAISDTATPIEAGTNKFSWPVPYDLDSVALELWLGTPQTSGSIFTVDVNVDGASVLSTKLTVDNGESSSTSAATPAVLTITSLAKGARITVDVDQVGDGTACNAVVTLKGIQTAASVRSALISPVLPDATTNHDVVSADVRGYLRMTDAAANTVTFQTQATEPLDAGFELTIRCVSAGGTTLVAASGVTLNAPAGGSLVLAAGMTVLAKWVGADEWDLMGQTS